MRIFVDESGFTGEDLANIDQPIFVIASTKADDSAAGVFQKSFSGVQSRELKHSSLARTEAGRRRVRDFFQQARGSGLFAVYVVHKQFCLLTKLVDLWVEPWMRNNGIDFYERGASRNFCNMTWFCLRTFESQDFLTQHLSAFQEMLRARTVDSYKSFWQGLRRYFRSCRSETREILEYFLCSESELGYEHLVRLPKRSLDICCTSALRHVEYWRTQTEEPLQIIHDASSNMGKDIGIWDVVTSADMPAVRVSAGGFAAQYPLQVTETVLCDSTSVLQLQLADVVAGATAVWSRSMLFGAVESDYAQVLVDAGIKEHLIGGIWPVPEIEPDELEPGSSGGSAYLDILTEVLHKKGIGPKSRSPRSDTQDYCGNARLASNRLGILTKSIQRAFRQTRFTLFLKFVLGFRQNLSGACHPKVFRLRNSLRV